MHTVFTSGMMKRILLSSALIMSLIGLMACLEKPPALVSGEIWFRSHDGTDHKRALTQPQLQQLSVWLAAHSSDWGMQLATDPLPTAGCEVKHADGHISSLLFYSENGWADTIKLCNPGPTGCVMRSFLEQKVLGFQKLLGIERAVI